MKQVTLWEVMVKAKRKPPFGMTFHDETEADVYADAMKAKGLEVEKSPAFETEESGLTALANAYKYWGV